jgi:hypothetical protein
MGTEREGAESTACAGGDIQVVGLGGAKRNMEEKGVHNAARQQILV